MSVPQARSFTLIEARELRDSVLLVRYRVDPVVDQPARPGQPAELRSAG